MNNNEIIPMTHLHTHTPKGSLLDGYMRIPKAIELAKSWGMDSIGVSDHGSMAAHKEFYDQVKEAGLHPVLGMEAYLTPNKTYKNQEFNTVKFDEVEVSEEDSKMVPKFIFKIVTLEELKTNDNLSTLDDITPKTYLTEILREKTKFLIQETIKTLDSDSKMPGIGTLRKMAKALDESLTSVNKVVAIQGDATIKKYFEWHPKMGHLLLIAKNNNGYVNMLKLNTIGQFEGFYNKPRIDFNDIKKLGKDIVATSACLGSISSRLILNGYLDEAKEHLLMLNDCFDEFFLEIQPSRQNDQHIVNKQLIEWSKELNIPLIATSDVHMISKDELVVHEAISNINRGNKNEAGDNDISAYDTAYFMHPQEMLDFGIPRQALQNAYDLSHRCKVDFLEDRSWKFPEYEVPSNHNFDSYLEELAIQGLMNFFLETEANIDINLYQNRLHYELNIIKQKKLSAYFVIVWDYVNFARSKDILVGPGRGFGSVASSVRNCI